MCKDCKYHNPEVTVKDAYNYGLNNGYNIADTNILDYDLTNDDNVDQFISDMLETESDHFRQFSPFEFYAKAFNDNEQMYNSNIWETYENGVYKGILKRIKEN